MTWRGKYDIIVLVSQAGREKKALDEERLRKENKSFVEQCRKWGKANQSMKEEIHHLMKEKEELKEKLETTEAQVNACMIICQYSVYI